MRSLNKLLRILVFSCLAPTLAWAGDPPPPQAVPGDLVTDYEGVKVADPYRALEDLKSPDTLAWADAQASYARRQLDRLPGRQALLERIAALDADRSPVIQSLSTTPGGAWFYLMRSGNDSVAKLYVRSSVSAPARLLLDPTALQKRDGVVRAINDFSVAPDGRHVAALVSVADSELGELQVFDTRSGERVLPPVAGIWGELTPTWSRDSQSMVYFQGAQALAPQSEPFGKMQAYQKYLDGRPDRKLAGWGEKLGPEVRAKDWLFIDSSSSAEFTLATRWEGIGTNARLAVARSSDLRRDPVHTLWSPVFDQEANVKDISAIGPFVYARSYQDASRYRVLRYDLRQPNAAPVEVVPQQTGVIDWVGAARDGMYYVVRTGSVSALFRLKHGAQPGSSERVSLPFAGNVTVLDVNAAVPGVVISLEGWTHELEVMRAEGPRLTRTNVVPPSTQPIGADWVAEEVSCTSHDGVQVPMSIVYRQGMVKDGTHPTVVVGYGGYGWPERAAFDRRLQAWFERGGVFAEVKPRGGGAFGRDWYQAGVGPTKSNTWKDMIACSEALIARGYTAKARLAILGRSMGGIAVGRAVTERPDLYAVGIVQVGITDAVRFIEASSNGPNHETEMGSVKTADGVRQLLSMSTYEHIEAGQAYPAMLFTAGMNDNRVAPWITFKTFARMAAATSSGRPVLLRVETAGGHGLTQTTAQADAELADRWAFVLWNTGDAGFQPPP